VAGRDGPDRLQDVLLRGAFQQVPTGTGPHRGENRLVVVEHCEHENGALGRGGRESARRLHAVHVRHPYIHHHHRRPNQNGFPDRLGTRRRLTDQFDALQR
jgi:hypothetical protein